MKTRKKRHPIPDMIDVHPGAIDPVDPITATHRCTAQVTRVVECDCRDDNAALFDVIMRDGRIYKAAHVHGSGGPMRGAQAIHHLIARIAIGDRADILVYTTWTASTSIATRIPVSDVHYVRLSQ